MKHTKGNWTADGQDGHFCIMSEDTDLGDIAHVNQFGMFTKEEAEANAKLIAASPELLEALQEVVNTIEMGAITKADKEEVKTGLTRCGVYEAIKKAIS